MKFGGKSLENPQKTQNICKYIKKIYKNDKKIIIIVSAIGNTTNDLIELSKKYGEDNSPNFVNGILASIVKESENLC